MIGLRIWFLKIFLKKLQIGVFPTMTRFTFGRGFGRGGVECSNTERSSLAVKKSIIVPGMTIRLQSIGKRTAESEEIKGSQWLRLIAEYRYLVFWQYGGILISN